MASEPQLVITGLGVISPIGIGIDPFWESLINGVSGVQIRPQFAGVDVSTKLAAQIHEFDPREHIKNRKAIKIMCAPIQHGCAAAMMACGQARIEAGSIDPERIGTVFGTETFYTDPLEVAEVFRNCTVDQNYQHDQWGEYAMRKIQPLWMLKYLPNMTASHISIMLDARGHSNTICQGEVSSLIALIEAAHVIRRGWCDVMVVGGTGSMCELSAMLYRGSNFSEAYNDQPIRASRPFELNRDGIVPGEGAAAVILESAEHASRRGAVPLAYLKGWSMSYCKFEPKMFSMAVSDCFVNALNHANLSVGDVGSINADASGRVIGDAIEAKAIERVFGSIPVVANKGHFGNLGPGTSMVESVAAILSLNHNYLPPTLNFDSPDKNCPVNASNQGCAAEEYERTILKSSISETGQIAAILVSKP